MRRSLLTCSTFLLLTTSMQLPVAAANEPAELATAWNAAVLEIAEAEDGFLTLKGVRTAAMMHLAMHDAINAVSKTYLPFAFQGHEPGANPVDAANVAAFTVVIHEYAGQSARLVQLRNQWPSSSPNAASAALGKATANAVLQARAEDGWDRQAEYRWHPMAPGVYAEFREHSGTPDGFVFGAGWAKAKVFALQSADQFRVPPPPAIDSDEYANAFDEVKAVGRFQSMTRTPDQTHLALWWKDFAENSHNRLARNLIAKEALSLTAAVRLLALINVSIFDAYVSSFENKFHYNHWRPYTAIRLAHDDGNERTHAEPTWTNTHRHTYAFPSYPSAHGTACAAAMTPFKEVFGDDYAFTMHTPTVDLAGPLSAKIEMQPPTRSFASFSGAARECGLSRVFLGIHFRYDSVEGVKLGEAVGLNAITKLLKPTP